MKKNNIYFLIEARIASTRLPEKVLKRIYKNYLAIDYVLKSILNSGVQKKNIILVTPKSKKNNKIWSYVKKNYGIKIFKGPEENVFLRVYNCCKKYKISKFARITSDNIFLDPIFLKKAKREFEKNNIDYLSSRTMIHSTKWKSKTDYNEGTSIEILKSNLLKKVKDLVNKANYEYPTWFIFSQPKKFKLKKFKLIKNYYGYQIKRFRTTLDTFVDLQFLRLVSKKLKLIPGENNLLRIIKSKKIDIYSKVNQKSEVKIAYRVIQQRNK